MSAGLSYDLAPPLGRTMAFFWVAPLSMVAAGVLVLSAGFAGFASSWMPETVALAHVGTLGFLASVMLGAVFQLSSVLGGVSIPGSRGSIAALLLFWLGLAAFLAGVLLPAPGAVLVGMTFLFLVLCWFAVSALWALRRAPTQTPTLGAMRTALWSLLAVVVLGTWMAHGYAGGGFPGPRGQWIQVHISMGLLGWVGALLVGVSWELVPMFYLTPTVSEDARARVVFALRAGLGAIFLLHLAEALAPTFPRQGQWLGMGASLVVGAIVWGWHPWSTIRVLRARRRKRVDPSKNYWLASMGLAPVTFGLGGLVLFAEDPRWALCFGWVSIWGWAGLSVHGMLTRIVPFLVWLHRFSKCAAHPDVPTMADLFPPRAAHRGLVLHVGTLLLALAAVWGGATSLSLAVGAGLILTGLHLAVAMVRAVSWPLPVSRG